MEISRMLKLIRVGDAPFFVLETFGERGESKCVSVNKVEHSVLIHTALALCSSHAT